MGVGMLLALGCSVCYGFASVLQAVAIRSVEPGSGAGLDAGLLLRAVRQWRYLAGLAVDGLGFVLQILALRMVPIYLVAAALAASVAVTAVAATWMLKARLTHLEWSAVGMVIAGLALLGFAAGPQGTGHPSAIAWSLIAVVVLILVAGVGAGRLGDGSRALALGVSAGLGFGVVEIGVRLIDSINPTRIATYQNPALYAVGVGGAAAFLLLTSALERGKVTTAVAGMVVGETVGPAIVGVVWLGDQTRPGWGPLVWTGFAVAVIGALALSRFGGESAPDQP